MISIVPIIQDPEYIFIRLNISVSYDVANIEIGAGEISALVVKRTEEFIQENLLKFKNSFCFYINEKSTA